MATKGSLKCNYCPVCDGYGCPGNMPGLGGVYENKNFQLNCSAWNELFEKLSENEKSQLKKIEVKPEMLRCGPVTGAVENIGYEKEQDFYFPYLNAVFNAGFGLCVGDGCPDLKLKLGIEALKKINEICEFSGHCDFKNQKNNVKAAFFLKPYPQQKLFERVELVKSYAAFIGIDIDSYNIVTMRNLVNLERKTEIQLEEFRNHFDVPFVIKGVFTKDDIELVRKVKPDVVYISNHGGRVETRIGSTGEFLAENVAELKKYCKQIWVDGGIRTKQNIQTAIYYGADQVILARPFIRAVFEGEDLKSLF